MDTQIEISDDDDSFSGPGCSKTAGYSFKDDVVAISSDEEFNNISNDVPALSDDEELPEVNLQRKAAIKSLFGSNNNKNESKKVESKKAPIRALFPQKQNVNVPVAKPAKIRQPIEAPKQVFKRMIEGVNVTLPVNPYGSQVALMSKIITAIKKSENCILESPTGSGKTLALLCGALAWQQHEQIPSSISQLIRAYDYETDTELLDAIPEREWRLLAALAKKREEHEEREKLAVQFRKLWQREQEERKMVEAETSEQYKRYIVGKRREEQNRLEFKQHLKSVEQQLRRRELMDTIRNKEQRSANLLAMIDDQKTSFIIDKALEDEARAQLAADRRTRNSEVEEFKKHIELIGTQKRSDEAMRRRNAMLKDASQRVAISNALNHWESALLRQEVIAMDAAKRAHHAAHAALTDARSVRLLRAKDARRRRARKLAYVTEQLRDAIRCRAY